MMTSSENKKSMAIALFLLLTIAISLVALPSANAQNVGKKKTYAFIGAVPNPVGVGQEVLIHLGITDEKQTVTEGWEGLSVTIEKPDGTTQTISGLKTDSTGGTGTTFTPNEAGNYTLQAHFPEQWYNYTGGSIFGVPIEYKILHEASDSEELTLVVTEERIQYYPGVQLPTEYWTRPIDAQAREWSVIAGNWLAVPANRFAPYNEGPETAHILWAETLEVGGLVGAELDDHGFECGDAYEGKFMTADQGSVIISGILFYNKYATSNFFGDAAEQMVCAVDLHTGENLWCKVIGNNERLAFGQIMCWDTQNYHGAWDYLWTTVGTTWNAYDPTTGRWEYTMTNVPSGTRVFGPNGEILIYTVDTANGWMTMWNSSNVPALYGASTHPTDPDYTKGVHYYAYGSWCPWGKTVNATGPIKVSPDQPLGIAGYTWNKTIPTGLPGSVMAVLEDRIIGSNLPGLFGALTGVYADNPVTLWGISLEPGDEGDLLFDETWTPPAGNLTIQYATASVEDGVFVFAVKELRGLIGFSLETGKYLWGPTEPQNYLNMYTLGESRAINRGVTIAYGKLFSTGVSGIVYCYDVQTGDLLWTYEAEDPYAEILWANNWWLNIAFVTDGKIYLVHDEHSPIDPKPRGAPSICLNATTGEEIWRADGLFRGTQWGGTGIIGDSIIATMDTYDQRIYAIGKGPSATTVSIQNDVITHGDSVLIKGTVTDISPGTEEYALTARFPHGVPAVSDANMSDWMQYVYKQFARPADVMGVEVVVSVLDPNGNSYEVGTTTSDDSGFYKLSFTPLVPGEYTVIATFEGSGAYYGSYSETAINVKESPAATPVPTPVPQAPVETYFTVSTIAIIAAIAIAVVLMLRKR